MQCKIDYSKLNINGNSRFFHQSTLFNTTEAMFKISCSLNIVALKVTLN